MPDPKNINPKIASAQGLRLTTLLPNIPSIPSTKPIIPAIVKTIPIILIVISYSQFGDKPF